jgi:hypothetical protein
MEKEMRISWDDKFSQGGVPVRKGGFRNWQAHSSGNPRSLQAVMSSESGAT